MHADISYQNFNLRTRLLVHSNPSNPGTFGPSTVRISELRVIAALRLPSVSLTDTIAILWQMQLCA